MVLGAASMVSAMIGFWLVWVALGYYFTYYTIQVGVPERHLATGTGFSSDTGQGSTVDVSGGESLGIVSNES